MTGAGAIGLIGTIEWVQAIEGNQTMEEFQTLLVVWFLGSFWTSTHHPRASALSAERGTGGMGGRECVTFPEILRLTYNPTGKRTLGL
eukprot:1392926-Amorphochlora_amoeboformis.AAC.2